VIYEAFAHTVTGFFDRATAQYLGVLLVVLQDVGHPAYFFVETRISHIFGFAQRELFQIEAQLTLVNVVLKKLGMCAETLQP